MPHSDAGPVFSNFAPAAPSTPRSLLDAELKSLPYWLVNVPEAQWPRECPEYLLNVPQKTIDILSTPDAQYKRQSWEEVKKIIKTNRIDLFHRVPSDLRRYLEYTANIKAQYGSVFKFVLTQRLHWEGELKPKGSRPFECPDDMKVLYNDWPYGLEEGIVHLVVWTKFELVADPETDDLTPQARKEIDDWVDKVFRTRVPAEKVRWFKNWSSIKSVHAIEHFHVLLYQPDMEFVREVTHGDVPLVKKL